MIRRIVLAVVVLLVVALAGVAGVVYWLLAGDGARLALEQQGSAWLGQPVRIGAATAQVFPRIGLRLQNVQVGEPAQITLADVQVSTGFRELLSRRVEGAELIVADSRIDMPLPFAIPAGDSGTADTSAGADFQIASVRTIRLRNVTVASRGREVTLSLESSLNDSVLTLSSVSAASNTTTITGRGSVKLLPEPDADLDITATRLDLDDLLALATAFAPAPTAGRAAGSGVTPGRIVARISAESVLAAGLTVPQFSTTARVQGGRVSLSPTRFILFGGRYEGDLDLNLRDTATAMTLTSRVRDVDVAQLAAFGGVPDTVTGKLSGDVTVSGRGNDLAAVLASARGTGNASIVDGTISRLNLVRTVVLFFGRPAPETAAGSDAFERIDARFSLARQIVTADVLSLTSRDADIVGQGTLSLESKALNGRADLSLSEELTAQAGTDFARYTREGNRIVLPAAIGGTLEAPRLAIDAAAAVKRGLRNEMQRRLKGILDRFGSGGN